MTYTLVEDLVEARHIGPFQVKGIHAPVDVWELLALRADSRTEPSYLDFQDGRIRMPALDLDPARLSENERTAIQQALSQALAHLAMR